MVVPIIQCDGCGAVVPAALRGTAVSPDDVEGEARLADLRGQGWTLSTTLDLCPACTTAGVRPQAAR